MLENGRIYKFELYEQLNNSNERYNIIKIQDNRVVILESHPKDFKLGNGSLTINIPFIIQKRFVDITDDYILDKKLEEL